jgi:hypothetical protein
VQYRQGGRSRRATIGEHGRFTPDQARSEARKLLGAVESGSDPVAERAAARAMRTLGEIAADFLQLHVATKRKARTYSEYRRILHCISSPLLAPSASSTSDVPMWRGSIAPLPARHTKQIDVSRSYPRYGSGQAGVTRLAATQRGTPATSSAILKRDGKGS